MSVIGGNSIQQSVRDRGSLVRRRFEDQFQVRRPKLGFGIEVESFQNFVSTGAIGLVRRIRGLRLDFDELTEVVDGVEDHLVLAERVPIALLPDRRHGIVTEAFEDVAHRFAVADAGLELLAGFGLGIDERSLVGQSRRLVPVGQLSANPERLVGFRKAPVGGPEVGVLLDDAFDERRVRVFECPTNQSVIGTHLDLDLVHTTTDRCGRQ